MNIEHVLNKDIVSIIYRMIHEYDLQQVHTQLKLEFETKQLSTYAVCFNMIRILGGMKGLQYSL